MLVAQRGCKVRGPLSYHSLWHTCTLMQLAPNSGWSFCSYTVVLVPILPNFCARRLCPVYTVICMVCVVMKSVVVCYCLRYFVLYFISYTHRMFPCEQSGAGGVLGLRAGRARNCAVSRHVSDRLDDDRRSFPRHNRQRSHQLRQKTSRVRDPDADQAVSVSRLHVPHLAWPTLRWLVQSTENVRRQREVGLQQDLACSSGLAQLVSASVESTKLLYAWPG